MSQISTILSESAREFDDWCRANAELTERGREIDAYEKGKAFFLSKQRAVIEAVIAEMEGMKLVFNSQSDMKRVVSYNTAIQDVASRLKEALDTP